MLGQDNRQQDSNLRVPKCRFDHKQCKFTKYYFFLFIEGDSNTKFIHDTLKFNENTVCFNRNGWKNIFHKFFWLEYKTPALVFGYLRENKYPKQESNFLFCLLFYETFIILNDQKEHSRYCKNLHYTERLIWL